MNYNQFKFGSNSSSEGRDFVLKHSDCEISISTQMVSRSPRLGSIMKYP